MDNSITVDPTIGTRLTAAAKTLNEARDMLNLSFVRVNELIACVSPGVEAWVNVSKAVSLGYAKVGGHWGLAIMSAEDTWPITASPGKLRVMSVPHIPKLLEQLVINTEAMRTNVVEATIELEGYVAAMRAALQEIGDAKK